MTALAERPESRLAVGETFDPAVVRSYPTERTQRIAAGAFVRTAVTDRAEQIEVMAALFGSGQAWRKRAANARARERMKAAGAAPVKREPRGAAKPPMVPIGPAREHVLDLTSRGMRQQAIAQAAGASDAAVSMLVRGSYKKGNPPRTEVTADLEARILKVEFVAPKVRQPKPKSQKPRRIGRGRCRSTTEFELAGDRVGRCLACGELAPLYRGQLTEHKTRQGGAS